MFTHWTTARASFRPEGRAAMQASRHAWSPAQGVAHWIKGTHSGLAAQVAAWAAHGPFRAHVWQSWQLAASAQLAGATLDQAGSSFNICWIQPGTATPFCAKSGEKTPW